MHTYLYLTLALVCKVDLLCGLPKEKGAKVTASGRKKYTHPWRPLSVYVSHAPLPKVLNPYVHTLIPPPTIFGLGYEGLRLLVGLGPGTRYTSITTAVVKIC